ncbi:hypothetical protein Ancab_030613 [Ancistrocladus abbreviatus]
MESAVPFLITLLFAVSGHVHAVPWSSGGRCFFCGSPCPWFPISPSPLAESQSTPSYEPPSVAPPEPAVRSSVPAEGLFDVRAYGAIGDGITDGISIGTERCVQPPWEFNHANTEREILCWLHCI